MSKDIDRRQFLAGGAAVVAAPFPRRSAGQRSPAVETGQAPAVRTGAVKPVVVSDLSGFQARNGGPLCAVEKAFQMMTNGADVLDAIVAGINIPELDPAETGIGFGGLPNADGVVQLDSCCMHGPKKRAGAVAALEGVRTPSLVAKAVLETTDHHLLVGKGAQEFARANGLSIEQDLNTPRSRELWLEWKRRIDPEHYLDPKRRDRAAFDAAWSMLRDGLVPESSFWGTINCNAVGPTGDICGATSTSGTAWKIPGRAGDSPIIGAGVYVDNEVGAAGSTGRGEANLYNLTSFLIVEEMRCGRHPKDAGLEGLRRIRANTIEKRLLNERGLPSFNIRFFVLDKKGESAGVSMYASGETNYAVCTENGAELRPLEPLLDGEPG